MRTDTVSLRLGADCSFYIEGHDGVAGRFHVLQCELNDPAMTDTFALLVDALIVQLIAKPATAEDLTSLFRSLTRLFTTSPARDSVSERQGLWGELFVMMHAGGAALWVPFWHSTPYKRFDFSWGHLHLEVKTTLGMTRAHTFSHRQLFPADDEQIVVASLLLREDREGISLRDLIDHTRNALAGDPTQLAKLEASVRSAGMTDPTILGPSFSDVAATTGLAWFWAEKVPRFTQPEPPGVSQTQYVVDLSMTPSMPSHEVEAWLSSWLSGG